MNEKEKQDVLNEFEDEIIEDNRIMSVVNTFSIVLRVWIFLCSLDALVQQILRIQGYINQTNILDHICSSATFLFFITVLCIKAEGILHKKNKHRYE